MPTQSPDDELLDRILVPRRLLQIAGYLRSKAEVARQLGDLATEIEERGVCPWCAAVFAADGMNRTCPNPRCEYLLLSRHRYVRS